MAAARAARPKRPSLDREVIIEAALQLSQQPDVDAMSFRALGRELGADPTAVYRYFRDRNELVEACLDRIIGQAAATGALAPTWRERLLAAAEAYLALSEEHPVLGAEAGHRTTGGPGELAMLELILAALREAGLSRQDAVRYYPLLAGYAAAMAAANAAYLLQDDRALTTQERIWVSTWGLLDPAEHPTAVELREELAVLRTQQVFRSGLELLLDAVEATVARTTPGIAEG
ncbi:MAG: TetR/AcrR family transcriptional regulator [Nitriliruptoraceae bacterium]